MKRLKFQKQYQTWLGGNMETCIAYLTEYMNKFGKDAVVSSGDDGLVIDYIVNETNAQMRARKKRNDKAKLKKQQSEIKELKRLATKYKGMDI